MRRHTFRHRCLDCRGLLPEPHGQRNSYAGSATPQNMDLGLRLRTGHEHGGLTDATTCSAAERKNDRVRAYGRARGRHGYPAQARQQLLNAI